MTTNTRLFTLTSWLLKSASIACMGLSVLLVLGLGILVLAVTGVAPNPIPADAVPGIAMALVLQAGALVITACVLCVGLVALVLLLISRIVDSAIAGDPFVERNAMRLNRVGLLLLALQVVGLVTGLAVATFPAQISDHLHFGFDVSLSGLFAALLVFVLAQIFRRGSEMRAELEGTV